MIDNDSIYFIEVCKTLSIKNAAKNCNIDVSTISKSLKRIESFYKIKLFKKGRKSILELTECGKKYLEYCKEVEKAHEKLLRSLNHITKVDLGIANLIHVNEAFGLSIRVKAMGIQLKVNEVNYDIFQYSLANHNIDLFIGGYIQIIGDSLAYKQLGETQLYAIFKNQKSNNDIDFITKDKLHKYNIVLSSSKHFDIAEYLRNMNYTNIVLLDSIPKIIEMILKDVDTISISHENIIPYLKIRGIQCVKIQDLKLPYGIYYHKEANNNLKAFVNSIVESYASDELV